MQIIKSTVGIHYINDFSLREYIINLVETVEETSYHIMGVQKFEDIFGGDLFIIENEEDLKWIYTTNPSTLPLEKQLDFTGGWASIVETPDAYDSCNYIIDGEYVEISLCTNNNGGNIFIIPRGIADKCPNIAESIKRTNVAWGNDNEDI